MDLHEKSNAGKRNSPGVVWNVRSEEVKGWKVQEARRPPTGAASVGVVEPAYIPKHVIDRLGGKTP